MECGIHLVDSAVDLIQISQKSAEKLRSCAVEWISIDEVDSSEYAVSSELLDKYGKELNFPDTFCYHRLCYSRFTDKNRFLRATKRSEMCKCGGDYFPSQCSASHTKRALRSGNP